MNNKSVVEKPPVVISYLRFSRPEQLKGDSTRRQLEMSEKWAAERGLLIDESLSDKGVSAFRGANAMTGALASFLALVEQGKVPPGSILLVESLDRLSRAEEREALQRFLGVVNAGIKIVTLADGYEYSKDNCDMMNLMYSLMIMARAHDESKTKSKRLSAAWGAKRDRIQDEPLTAQLPRWLTIENNRVVADSARAELVVRIFKLARDGFGLHAITKKLNSEGVSLGGVGYFVRSYVSKILHNRAVLGEFQPHKVTYTNGTKRRVPVGPVVKGYYPAIVDDDTFYAVQQSLKSRQRGGGRGTAFINLFQGLLFDFGDGSPLQIQDKGYGRRYVSSHALGGIKGHSLYCAFPVEAFEGGFAIPMADRGLQTSSASDDRTDELHALQGRMTVVEKKIEDVQVAMVNDDQANTAAVILMLTQLDKERMKLGKQIESLRGQTAAAEVGMAKEFVELLRCLVEKSLDNEKRTRLRAVIKRLVKRIHCDLWREGKKYYCDTFVALEKGGMVEYRLLAEKGTKGPWALQWTIVDADKPSKPTAPRSVSSVSFDS